MDFDWNGETKHWIQFGGVITDEAYRKKGLSRMLMEEAIKDNESDADTIFLLANHTVHEFYPKFGFTRCHQLQCSKEVQIEGERTAVPVSLAEKANWSVVEAAIRNSASNSVLEMSQGAELVMLYLTEIKQDSVYYIEELGAYVVADQEEEEMILAIAYRRLRTERNFRSRRSSFRAWKGRETVPRAES